MASGDPAADTFNAALLALNVKNERLALELFEKCLKQCERPGARTTLPLGLVLHHLGSMQRHLVLYVAALATLERARGWWSSAEAANYADFDTESRRADCDMEIATIYRQTGRHAEAILKIDEAMRYCLRRESTNFLRIGEILYSRGASLRCQGRLEESLKNLQSADAYLVKGAAAERDPVTKENYARSRTSTSNYLAATLKAMGRHAEAIESSRRVVESIRMLDGTQNVEYATCLASLADLENTAGQYAECEKHLDEALRIIDSCGARGSLQYGGLLASFGNMHQGRDRLQESLRYYEEARNIYERNYPPDHPLLGALALTIAGVQARLGNEAAAAEAAKEGEFIVRRSQSACAGPACSKPTKADGSALDACGGCRRTHYCSVACQRADWKARHKAECKALAAAAAAAAAARK